MGDAEKTPQFHYSNLAALNQCGAKFEFRYVKKVRLSPTAYLHVGRAVDTAANTNFQSKLATQTLLPVDQIVDLARDTVTHSIDKEGIAVESGLDTKTETAEAVDKAVRLAKAHATKLAPRLEPKRVQTPWSLTIPGLPFDLVGTRDLDDANGCIRDLKTSGKSPSGNAADVSMQLSTYALAAAVIDQAEVPIPVAIDTIVDLKGGQRYVPLTSHRTKADFRVLLNRLENAAKALESGVFVPTNPERDPLCSVKYCEYASMCPYFLKPKSLVLDPGEGE